MKMNKKQKGFTLIEVLIVIAMIAVLSTIVLIGLGPSRKIGRDARRVADLRQVQGGLELYFNKCRFYPGTTDCVGGFSAAPSDWNALKTVLTGSSIGVSQVPDDPNSSATNQTHYAYGSLNGTSYTLGATLEDTNSPSLKESAPSGNGITCGGQVYCLQL